ncbi:MAG TPA: hypothetical protein VJ890_22685, partial [Vineibacter sp.]|nr:hypothetical protein [Vineibacter sp.]
MSGNHRGHNAVISPNFAMIGRAAFRNHGSLETPPKEIDHARIDRCVHGTAVERRLVAANVIIAAWRAGSQEDQVFAGYDVVLGFLAKILRDPLFAERMANRGVLRRTIDQDRPVDRTQGLPPEQEAGAWRQQHGRLDPR